MNDLALKVAVPMLLVGLATLAGRRWGDVAAGLVGGLPVVAGPILFFYALEQGPVFAAEASTLTLLSIVSLSFYLLTFAWRSASGATALNCLLLGWLAFAACTLLMERITSLHTVGLPKALAYALAVLFLSRRSLPKQETAAPANAFGPVAHSPWDLPLRVASAALLVLLLTGMAQRIGPRLGGLLTAFPVASTVLTVFAYQRGGRDAVLAVIKGLLLALNAYAVFCATLALTLPRWSLGFSFLAATLATLAVQASMLELGLGGPTVRRRPAKTS